jgi:hypothetical protein
MSARLSIRFSPRYERWIGTMGGDQAEAVRALMTLGAAALGWDEADNEAMGLLREEFPAAVRDALMVAAAGKHLGRQSADIPADKVLTSRQTSGRQAADGQIQETDIPPPPEPFAFDPMTAGIEV